MSETIYKVLSFNYKRKVKQDYDYYYEKFLSIPLIKGFEKILYKTFYSNIQTALSTTSSSLLDCSGFLAYKVCKFKNSPDIFFIFHRESLCLQVVKCQNVTAGWNEMEFKQKIK